MRSEPCCTVASSSAAAPPFCLTFERRCSCFRSSSATCGVNPRGDLNGDVRTFLASLAGWLFLECIGMPRGESFGAGGSSAASTFCSILLAMKSLRLVMLRRRCLLPSWVAEERAVRVRYKKRMPQTNQIKPEPGRRIPPFCCALDLESRKSTLRAQGEERGGQRLLQLVNLDRCYFSLG